MVLPGGNEKYEVLPAPRRFIGAMGCKPPIFRYGPAFLGGMESFFEIPPFKEVWASEDIRLGIPGM